MITFLVIGFTASFIILEFLIILEGSKKEIGDVDYMIILGARLYGSVPSPALRERLNTAVDYLQVNKDLRVVVTGAQGDNEDLPEGVAMAEYLMDRGIKENRIIIEAESFNTFLNLRNSLAIIRKENDKEKLNILLVTNRFHMFRSKLLARRLGLNPYGLPAEIPPSIVFKSYVREYFATIKSILVDY